MSNINYSWEGIENVSTNMIENGENNNGVGSHVLAIKSAEAIMNCDSIQSQQRKPPRSRKRSSTQPMGCMPLVFCRGGSPPEIEFVQNLARSMATPTI